MLSDLGPAADHANSLWDLDNYVVGGLRELQLTAESAGITQVIDQLEEVFLIHRRIFETGLVRAVDVARRAGHVPAALTNDPGDSRLDCDLHDAFTDVASNDSFFAWQAESYFGHRL
jgi:hypothetical protein